MEQHYKIVGVLQIIYGAFFVMIGVLIFLIVAGAGAISGDRTAIFVTGTVAIIIAGLFIVFSAPSILAGFGVLKGRQWGRVLTIVLSIIHLLNFPIGTIVGAYSLWVMLSEPASIHFH